MRPGCTGARFAAALGPLTTTIRASSRMGKALDKRLAELGGERVYDLGQ